VEENPIKLKRFTLEKLSFGYGNEALKLA